MTRARSIANRARRRRMLRSFVRWAGPALLVGSVLALIGAITDRLIGPGLPWWLWIAAPTAVAFAIGLLRAFVEAGTPLSAAAELDAALRLHDAIGSGIALEDRAGEDPFAQIALEEAERLAARADVRSAFPLRFGSSWLAWPLIGAAAAAVAAFVPPLRLLHDQRAEAVRIEQAAQRADASEAIQQLAQELQELATPEPDVTADAPRADRLRALEELERQLARGETSADEARSSAAGILGDLASEMDRSSQFAEQRADAVRRMLSEAAAGAASASESPNAADIADSLRWGDLDRALQSLDDLHKRLNELAPEERERTARALEDLAEQIALEAEKQQQRAEENAEQRERELLERAGLPPETSEALDDDLTPEELIDQLRDHGLDEQSAERLAEQLARERTARDATRDAAEHTEDLSEALRDAADDIRQPGPPTPPTDQPASQHDPASTEPRPEQQKQQPTPDPNQPREPGDPDQRRPGSGEQRESTGKDPNAPAGTESGTPRTPAEPREGTGASPDPAQAPTDSAPDQQAPGESPAPKEGAESPTPDDQAPTPPDPDTPATPRDSGETPEQRDGAKPDDPSQGAGDQPGSPQPAQPDGAQPGAGEQPTPGQGPPQPGDPKHAQPGEGGEPEPSREGAPSDAASQREGMRDRGSGAGNGADPRGMERLRDQLHRLREDSAQGEDQRNRAQDLRERAQRLLDGMSDEERDRLERWAAQQQRELDSPDSPTTQPGPGESLAERLEREGFRTDAVDARQSSDEERVVAEWLANRDADERADRTISTREMTEVLREAARSADQAIDEQVVPARYRNVREYFRKALERAGEAERSAPPPPSDSAVVPAPQPKPND